MLSQGVSAGSSHDERKWLITIVSKSPNFALPNGRPPWLINRGDPITTCTFVLGAHPPSTIYLKTANAAHLLRDNGDS